MDGMSNQSEQSYRFDQIFFQKQAHKNYQSTIKLFKSAAYSYSFFNIGFFLLFFVELLCFAFFFAYLSKSSILALILGGIFLSCFTYFVLLFYFQAKKSEQLTNIKDHFIETSRRAISVPMGSAEHHLTLAHAAIRLAQHLHNMENKFYQPPKWLNFTSFLLQRIGIVLHKEDVFKFQEQLLLAAIQEHIKQIKCTPTDLEMHASIANAYSTLSKLYMDALNASFASKNLKILLKQKFDAAVKNTIEEFKILNDYAPNDPWVHAQLANSYRILYMLEEEANEHEIILKLCPNDYNILYRLGVIYFEMGAPSKALRVYEKLKEAQFKKADDLLSHYGVSKSQEIFEETI